MCSARTTSARSIEGVRLAEANVLTLDALPETWTGYDLVVSASMLEYVPSEDLPDALAACCLRGVTEGESKMTKPCARRCAVLLAGAFVAAWASPVPARCCRRNGTN